MHLGYGHGNFKGINIMDCPEDKKECDKHKECMFAQMDTTATQLIQKTVAETLEKLDVNHEAIVNDTLRLFNKDKNILSFKDEEEMKKFESAIPKLIALDESVEVAKNRGKWILIVIAGYVLKDFYEFFTHALKIIMDLANTDLATILKPKGQ